METSTLNRRSANILENGLETATLDGRAAFIVIWLVTSKLHERACTCMQEQLIFSSVCKSSLFSHLSGNINVAWKINIVALTETFRYLELCSTCLKEGLG
jgi:hypothetical protein